MSEETKYKKLVIFDANIPELGGNKLFIPELAYKISHTILPVCHLYETAESRGIKFITPDVYLQMENKPRAFLFSHLYSAVSNDLVSNFGDKVKPLVLMCQESPFIATNFYVRLFQISKKFKHSFVFSGMERRLNKTTVYHQMFFPSPYGIKDFNPVNFNDKQFITMVSGAKSIGNWKKNLILKILYGLSVKEIYQERLKAIRFFAAKEGFDLYGRGWDKAPFKESYKEAIAKSYQGAVDDKFKILKGFKFTICFENSIFPGYITEKIFDAIFAGSIPIYLGAPDIKKYVPADVFIDFRDFKNYNDLYNFILSIDEEKYNNYLKAMRSFIVSDDYKKFSQEYFADRMLDIIEDGFDKK